MGHVYRAKTSLAAAITAPRLFPSYQSNFPSDTIKGSSIHKIHQQLKLKLNLKGFSVTNVLDLVSISALIYPKIRNFLHCFDLKKLKNFYLFFQKLGTYILMLCIVICTLMNYPLSTIGHVILFKFFIFHPNLTIF